MLENEVDFALLQEPLNRVFGDKVNHMGIAGGFTICSIPSPKCRALILHKPSLPVVFVEHLSTPDCSVVRVSLRDYSFFLVSAYFDGERQISVDLNHLDLIITAAPFGRVLIHMDSNARSSVWFDALTNTRGTKLDDWFSEKGLAILNNSPFSTFIRPDGTGKSCIDITVADQETRKLVDEWRLCHDVDSLSDHKMIELRIATGHDGQPRVTTRKYSPRESELPVLARALAFAPAFEWDANTNKPEYVVREFNNRLLEMCDNSISRSSAPKPRRSLLWWDRGSGCPIVKKSSSQELSKS
jgi:hypothetical protein